MEQYNVTGMSCAACQTRVEKAVSKVPGVTSCAVSLLTNSMGVEGTASPAEIIAAVENAGYGASKKGEKGSTSQSASTAEYEEMLKDKETPVMRRRLVSSVFLLIPLMYFSMGHMMWGWPLPKWFDGNHVAMGLVQLLLAGIIMAQVISKVSQTPSAISVPAILFSVIFSMVIGILFGLLPSIKAANLNPIDALRHE